MAPLDATNIQSEFRLLSTRCSISFFQRCPLNIFLYIKVSSRYTPPPNAQKNIDLDAD